MPDIRARSKFARAHISPADLECDTCFRQPLFPTHLTEVRAFCVFNECCVLTCDGGEFEQVSVQVDVHPGAVVGQGDASAVPPDRQVLVEAEDQTSQSHLNRLSPGEGTSPPGIVSHQHLVKIWKIQVDLGYLRFFYSPGVTKILTSVSFTPVP